MASGEIPTHNKESKLDICINVEDLPKSKLVEILTSSITTKLNTLPADSYTVCIYKVSEKHRKVNEEAYAPRLVSIGPLHHGKSHLQAMDAYKLRCLKNFRSRFSINIGSLVKFATDMESSVRGCYEDTINFNSKEFSEIILLDGIFVVELFLKNYFNRMRDQNDILFENRWMASDLLHDMLLLENQLPLNFTSGLFNFVDSASVHQKSFIEITREYFKDMGNTKRLQLKDNCDRARHLVELLLYLHQPSSPREESSRRGKFEYTRSASELQEAGVRFISGVGECLFSVSFSVSDGVLTIPQLTVNDWTETFFRNLIAFEQCGHYYKSITSYIIFMDSLINTPKDVELLVKHKIIENLLGESQLVADLFNNLYKEVVVQQDDFYFAKICDDLNNYSKDNFHQWKSAWFKWKVMARNTYFSSPWSITSLIAAFILLSLTIVQTVCSVIGV